MTGRERLLTAIHNKKPDRLPCQIHAWLPYHLKTVMNGMSQAEAYAFFKMDPVIYISGEYLYKPEALAKWDVKTETVTPSRDGVTEGRHTVKTPKGVLTVKGAQNDYTSWETEHIVKDEKDFELFKEFYPEPYACDWTPVANMKKQIGGKGIVRSLSYFYGQPGIWQTLCCLMGTENAIMKTFDEPEWVHYALNEICLKYERAIEKAGKTEADIIETGGGSASSTVISPALHREFCLPYDKRQHAALKAQGAMISYHLCGGHMPLLETVAENGADCLETMTPPSMGADCRLAEAKQRVGKKLAFIGGFDQNAGFENGNPVIIKKMVEELFAACPDGGYICCPSDQFFIGSKENIRAFADACKACKY